MSGSPNLSINNYRVAIDGEIQGPRPIFLSSPVPFSPRHSDLTGKYRRRSHLPETPVDIFPAQIFHTQVLSPAVLHCQTFPASPAKLLLRKTQLSFLNQWDWEMPVPNSPLATLLLFQPAEPMPEAVQVVIRQFLLRLFHR